MKRISWISLSLLFAIVFFSSCSQKSKESKPNIIVINIDDMGWKDVGFMGSTYYETPNIDSLASMGMSFTNGYAAASNCAPSRACLMTGKWTPRHGIYTVDNSDRGVSRHRKLIPTPNTVTLSNEHEIIPEALQKNGYITCHAGKWHLSKNPLEYGFNVNIGGSHAGHPKSYYPPYKNVKIQEGKNTHLTNLIMEKAIEFVDTVNQPFFLYYSPYAVHGPLQAIDSLLDKYKSKLSSKGQDNARYATMIENVDRNIGLLLSKLEEKELINNTLIVFTSDNGAVNYVSSQAPLRAGKGSYYEGGIREPFLFVWKDKIKANSKSNIPITNIDIFPTLLGVAGLEDKDNLHDGTNLLPILKGDLDKLERPLFWHFPIYLQANKKKNNENRDPLFRTRPGSVIRYGNWKLHYYFENNDIELYNLADDIGERNNLANREPDKAKEMLDYLKSWWEQTNAPIPKTLNPEYEKLDTPDK